jgi:hypothetical protein
MGSCYASKSTPAEARVNREWQSVDEETLRQIAEAVEAAGNSGLCEEGRLEIGLQGARRLLPQLDEATPKCLVNDRHAT